MLAVLCEPAAERAVRGRFHELDLGAAVGDEGRPAHAVLAALEILIANEWLLDLAGIEHLQQLGPVLDGPVEVLDEQAHVGKRSTRHRRLLHVFQPTAWIGLEILYARSPHELGGRDDGCGQSDRGHRPGGDGGGTWLATSLVTAFRWPFTTAPPRAPTSSWSTTRTRGPLTPRVRSRTLVAALERPRRIIAMVKAGPPVDAVIDELTPLLDEGDIIIDAGNSHYADTRRRTSACAERGLRFLGTGVSGGEEGRCSGRASCRAATVTPTARSSGRLT